MVLLLSLSFAIMAGLFVSRFTKKLKLPHVTGYLIAGILIGPFCLGALGISGIGFNSLAQIKELSLFSDLTLGFIAFAIGNEFRVSQIKAIGKQAAVIAVFQALLATLLVDAALIGLHFVLGPDKLPLSAAITLGAIASATAPAATLMVVRQYKAKGKLTDILLPVVALDDAVGLVIFSVSFGIAKSLELGALDMVSIIVSPLVEIVLSLALGALAGAVLTYVEKYFHSNSKRLCLAVTFVMLTVALSKLSFSVGPVHCGFSPLLVCMMLGTVFCNLCDWSEDLMEKTDKWTVPLFVLFFVMSGSELEFNVFADLAIIGVGVVYIAARSLGKYAGSFFSAKITKCDESIVKYLGVTLLPQAGVALGMSLTALQLGASGELVRNITLFSVLVYELVGPSLTKIALTKAGDIAPKPLHKYRNREEYNPKYPA
ncbi:MAG: cation:proton antiporter [Clostridia bacterium]|nr:cation:proton antiporter [Clostridia bacterium]